MNLKLHLIKTIDELHVRFYDISLSRTLFGEVVIERIYGNVAFRSHTGRKLDYIEDSCVALRQFHSIVEQKLKRGYRARGKYEFKEV